MKYLDQPDTLEYMDAQKHLKRLEEYIQFGQHIKLGKADLHIHSNHSDAKPSIPEILTYVQEKTDLDVIAIADHDTIDGALEAQELMKSGKYRFQLVIGEEISTKEGHILGLYLKKKIKKNLSLQEALAAIHAQEGIAVAAHPFQHTRFRNPKMPIMDGIGLVNLIKEKDLFNGVEVINATPTLSQPNLSAEFINNTLVLKAETGSSDAHILDAIGMGYTLFEGTSAEELHHAIVHHQTRAMHKKWKLIALFKYLFFFIPKGLRLAAYTLLYGRREKQPRIVR